MKISEVLNEDATSVWSVTLKDQWVDRADPDEYQDDIAYWEYDVRYNGKVVGSATYDDFFGNILGDFGARRVEMSKYADHSLYDENDMERFMLSAVGDYFNSKEGQRHFEVMTRQQGLEPQSIELDEIKVTKTLAGKRTNPTKDLASRAKMKKKKKDSKGKEVKDATTPMNRNVHDLANITLKGEYRS